MEDWRPIKDFEDAYEVSNFGRIRSLDRIVVDKGGKRKRIFKGKLLNNVCISSGYHLVSLHRGNKRITRQLVHRIVMKTFCPIENPEQFIVDHIDGVRTNNHIDNLRWTTFDINSRNTPYVRYLQDLLNKNQIVYIKEDCFEV